MDNGYSTLARWHVYGGTLRRKTRVSKTLEEICIGRHDLDCLSRYAQLKIFEQVTQVVAVD